MGRFEDYAVNYNRVKMHIMRLKNTGQNAMKIKLDPYTQVLDQKLKLK